MDRDEDHVSDADADEFAELELEDQDSGDEQPVDEPGPTGDEDAEEGQPEQQPADQAEEGAEEPAPPTTPSEATFTWKGQKLTHQQIIEQGLLEDIVTQANQNSHTQELYRDLKTKVEGKPEPKAEPKAEPKPQPLTWEQRKAIVERVRDQWHPRAVEAAGHGLLEEDFVQDYPLIASGLVEQDARIRTAAKAFDDRLKAVEEIIVAAAQEMQHEHHRTSVTSVFDEVAGSGDAFAGLKDQEHAAAFGAWINTEGNDYRNLDISMLTPRLLKHMYADFLAETGASPAAAKPPPAPKPDARLAAGEGGSPAAPRKKQKTAEDLFEEEMASLSFS